LKLSPDVYEGVHLEEALGSCSHLLIGQKAETDFDFNVTEGQREETKTFRMTREVNIALFSEFGSNMHMLIVVAC
jgi:hypothetical protein